MLDKKTTNFDRGNKPTKIFEGMENSDDGVIYKKVNGEFVPCKDCAADDVNETMDADLNKNELCDGSNCSVKAEQSAVNQKINRSRGRK